MIKNTDKVRNLDVDKRIRAEFQTVSYEVGLQTPGEYFRD